MISIYRELTTWLYQHSTAIESRRQFSDTSTIENYAVLEDKAILIITNNYSAEVYGLKSLHKEPLFRLHLRQPTSAFAFDEKSFILITNDGSVRLVTQETTGKSNKFTQTLQKQLEVKCLRLFCSMITIESEPSLVILNDDQQSLTIWTPKNVKSLNINLEKSPSSTVRLLQMTSDPFTDNILFYFENQSLTLYKSASSSQTSYDHVNLYSLKKNSLITVDNKEYQLNLHKIDSSDKYRSIHLKTECLQLCLNESGDYAFVLVKPRVLFMYRMADSKQIGKLFLYDNVTTMIANNDFIVLGMNDRRLLTLMIADPDDPNLKSKIDALPSR